MYAADLAYKTAQEQLAAWKALYAQQREDLQPFREFGYQAMETVRQGEAEGRWDAAKWEGTDPLAQWEPGDFDMPVWDGTADLSSFDPASVDLERDPGYQFRLQEGEKAIRRAASAGGGARDGATMKALTRFGQDYASNEYGKAYQRAVGEYQMNRANEVAHRQFALQDHDIARNRALTERGLALQDYQIQQDTALQNRQLAMSDYEINERMKQMDYARRMGQLQFGAGMISQDHANAAQAQTQQSAAAMGGATSLGMGRIGAAQARAQAQQNQFNNFMAIAGLAIGGYGTIAGGGKKA